MFSTASPFLTRVNCRFEHDRVSERGRQRPHTAFLENYRSQIAVSSRLCDCDVMICDSAAVAYTSFTVVLSRTRNIASVDVSIHTFRQLCACVSVRNQLRVDTRCCHAREFANFYTCVLVRNHFIRDRFYCQQFSRMKKTEPSIRPGLYSLYRSRFILFISEYRQSRTAV